MLRKLTPLKVLGAKRLRYDQVINRTTTRGYIIGLRGVHQGLNILTLSKQNVTEFRTLHVAKDRVDAGEGLRFAVLRPRTQDQSEAEPGTEGLRRIQMVGSVNVLDSDVLSKPKKESSTLQANDTIPLG